MSNPPKEKNVNTFYLELFRHIHNGEYDRSIKICNKILNLSNSEQKAFHCKVVCLIQLSKFEDAMQQIVKFPELSSTLYFEKAYCYYRLGNTEEAMKIIENVPKITLQLTELKAQILYRQEKYNDCYNLYRDIIKKTNDDYEDERQANITAVMSMLNMKETFEKEAATYEVMYNQAVQYVLTNNYANAERALRACEKMARESLEEDGITDEELDQELAIIRVQLAYVYQKQGRLKDAKNIYTDVLKCKIEDSGLLAVINNNLVAINKDQHLFDSKKRIRAATHESLEQKLNYSQRQTIQMNSCLLLFHLNQYDNCRKQCQLVVQKFPDAWPYIAVIEAMILNSEGKIKDAVSYLKKKWEEQPQNKLFYQLSAVQLLLLNDDKHTAREILSNIGENVYKPGVVSALVSLNLALDYSAGAAKVFEDTVSWYRKQKGSQGDLSAMWQKAAEFHMKHGNPAVAAESFEEILRTNPNDKRTIANLIMAYVQCKATEKVKKYIDSLPSIEDLTKDLPEMDPESITITGLKVKTEASPGTPMSDKFKKTKTKKRKRKNKYPPLPPDVKLDPERWLPKYERTGAKKKRDRRAKDVLKGSQGSSTTLHSENIDFSTKNIESKEDIILEETESGKSVTSMPSAASLGSGKGSNKQQKKKKKGVRR